MNQNYFISYDSALSIILNKVKPGKSKLINVRDATGFVLAKDVRSPSDAPPFNNSAMDGYAFRYKDYSNNNVLKIHGESTAGSSFTDKVISGQSVRIFTGAPIPPGCDTVVMQEKVIVNKGDLVINDNQINKGANVRTKGSQTKKGAVILNAKSVISPASIGLLCSVGVGSISVFAKPHVTIIVTGNELVPVGKKLKAGQIFESNSATLQSALSGEGIFSIKSIHVKDNLKDIQRAFEKALKVSDIILFTGGISVGDYDFTGKVLQATKVKTQFYKVKQKPGKPLYFGIKDSKYIFGLPGNPGSVLTCFYEYVLPVIRKTQQHPHSTLRSMRLPLAADTNKKKGMTVFYKAFTDFKTVKILSDQESYKMNSFSEANCFVVLGENDENIKKGALVDIHLLI